MCVICARNGRTHLRHQKLILSYEPCNLGAQHETNWIFSKKSIFKLRLLIIYKKNLWTQQPKKLHPSLKIDFFQKCQFCSYWAPIRLIWQNEILVPQRCPSAFCPDDAHRCSMWKWMLPYAPNTPRKTYAPNWSRKNYILAWKLTFLKKVNFAHVGRL